MNRTVLVVDDEQDIQDILTRYLQRIADVEVANVMTGEQAVERYRELLEADEAPALVVMDLNLSGANQDIEAIERHRKGDDSKMDGVDATRVIKDMDADAVIWGYTAWQGSSWETELQSQGVDRVVGRQVTFKEFAEQVADFLRQEE
ncbi:MAG: hypothetical protein R6U10_07135 [Thermoplasmatota archaeon]